MSWYDTLQFSCDWLNVVIDVPRFDQFLSDLCSAAGLVESSFVPMPKGQNFYKHSFRYKDCGFASIVVSCSPDEKTGLVPTFYAHSHPQHGILLSVSGDGCRYLQNMTKTWDRLLRFINTLPHQVTRLDMAMDIFDSLNPIVPLFLEFPEHAFSFNKGQVAVTGFARNPGYVDLRKVYDQDLKQLVFNSYIGSRTSKYGYVRCYNKKEEIRQGRLSSMAQEIFDSVGMTDNYWYRVEYVLKSTLAEGAFQNLLKNSPIDAFYCGANNLFKFIVLKYSGQSNISSAEILPFWEEFLGWLEQHKTIYFVEYHKSTQTYVPADGKRAINWLQRMSVFVAYLSMIEHYMPYLAEDLRRRGSEKLRTSGRQRRIDEDMFSIMNSGEFDYLSYKDPSGWGCPSSAPAQVNINNFV